jgi:hypothetical protein
MHATVGLGVEVKDHGRGLVKLPGPATGMGERDERAAEQPAHAVAVGVCRHAEHGDRQPAGRAAQTEEPTVGSRYLVCRRVHGRLPSQSICDVRGGEVVVMTA